MTKKKLTELKPYPQNAKKHFECSQCGAGFKRWKSQRRGGNAFCCYECKAKHQKGKHIGGNTEVCVICEKEFFVRLSAVSKGRKCCSWGCMRLFKKTLTGEKSARWGTGVYKHSKGYLEQPITAKKGRAKRMLQHRRVVEEFEGRKLTENEVVHHVDGDKTNNGIENLEVMTRSDHARLHALMNGLGRRKIFN